MFDAQHSKRPEFDRGQTTPEQKSANPKQGRIQQTGDPTRIPVYAQAWGDQPPPWLRLPTPQQHLSSPEQSLQCQVDEELQDDLVPQHMNEEPLPIPVQKGTLPVQRVEAVPIPAYTQLAWGNQPPPWLRLPVQRKELHEEALLQERDEPLTQRKENTTGLPDPLKAGTENLSGLPLDDVHVHYNSSKPAEVQALAYTQGTEIHVGPGQEQHLAHEAWHVVQQKQGRVKSTLQARDVAMNNDQGLERDADAMGAKALQMQGMMQSQHGRTEKPREAQEREEMSPGVSEDKVTSPVIQRYKEWIGVDTILDENDIEPVGAVLWQDTSSELWYIYLESGWQLYVWQDTSSGLWYRYDPTGWQLYVPAEIPTSPIESSGISGPIEAPSSVESNVEQTDTLRQKRSLEHSQNIPLRTESSVEEAKEWLKGYQITTRYRAVAFAESAVTNDDYKQANAVIDNWNLVYPSKTISTLEVGLTPEKEKKIKQQKQSFEERKKAEAERTADKPLGSLMSITWMGEKYTCELISNEGGYHYIYQIKEAPKLLVRIPKNANETSIAQGLTAYKELRGYAQYLKLPGIMNAREAVQQGFYIVEYIPIECDPTKWVDVTSLDQLRPEYRRQLTQIRTILENNARERQEVIPDFRPANIRFTNEQELVLIDFSESAEKHENLLTFANTMERLVRQFAGEVKGGKFNPVIYEWLTKNFDLELRHSMRDQKHIMY